MLNPLYLAQRQLMLSLSRRRTLVFDRLRRQVIFSAEGRRG
jgi:hypothetical protein